MKNRIAFILASFSMVLVSNQAFTQDSDSLTQKRFKAITKAVHGYVDAHKGEMPPPIVPNQRLPEKKRLSGLVLLLPYFIGSEELGVTAENAMLAKKIYESIDLEKAWDDPHNLPAASQLIEVFQVTSIADKKDVNGYCTSHFAFVRGYGEVENGAFPADKKVMIFDPTKTKDSITDGTVMTLAIGQIAEHLGPWTAAGTSTSRFVIRPSEQDGVPTFGSEHGKACYFTKCDGSLTFIDMKQSTPVGLRAIVTRSGRDSNVIKGNLRTYESADAWKEATGQ